MKLSGSSSIQVYHCFLCAIETKTEAMAMKSDDDCNDDDDDDALKVIQSSEECQTPTCGGAVKVNNFNQLQ